MRIELEDPARTISAEALRLVAEKVRAAVGGELLEPIVDNGDLIGLRAAVIAEMNRPTGPSEVTIAFGSGGM